MRMHHQLVIAFLFSVVTIGRVEPLRAEQEPVDKTGKVFSGVGNMIVARDEVASRYAFVALGEKHFSGREVRGGPDDLPIVRPFYAIRIVDRKKGFDYTAYADWSSGPQIWKEIVRCEGQLRIAKGYINRTNRYVLKPDGMTDRLFLEANSFDIFYFDPFDDLIASGNQFESLKPNKNVIEKIFMKEAEFLESTEILQGNVKSQWNKKVRSAQIKDLDITLVQSAAHDFLPTEIQYTCKHGFMKAFFTHTRCEWQKQRGFLVPHRVETASVRFAKGKPKTYQWHMKFHWLVGEDVPDAFFDCESLDYREPIRAHFDLDFDANFNGKPVRAKLWETPEDLFMDGPVLITDRNPE